MPPLDILLIEDTKVDAELIMEAIKDTKVPHRVHLVSSGEKALTMMRKDPKPDLVLLDLNLPKMSGIEVLKAIKRDAKMKAVPVVILSNSSSQDDVARCYSHYANAYVRKPLGFDLPLVIKITIQFWAGTAVLPQPYSSPPKSPRRKRSK